MKNIKFNFNAAASIIIFTLFTKIIGFLREVFFANYFGTSDIADVYKIVQSIPLVIVVFIGIGLSTGIIPLYTEISTNKNESVANSFLSNIFVIISITFIGISLIIFIMPNIFIKVFAMGFSSEKIEITEKLLRLSCISIIFSILRYIFIPYLQIHGLYVIPAIISIPSNIILIFSFIITKKFGFNMLAFGLIFSELIQLIIVLFYSFNNDFNLNPSKPIFNNDIKKLIKLSLPVVLSTAISQINVLVDKNMATFVEPNGGVAALDYATRLNGFVQGIFIFSLISIFFPKISKLFVLNKFNEAKDYLLNNLIWINIFVIPCTLGILLFSEEITRFIFQRGNFTNYSVMLTSSCMFFYATSLIFTAFREIIIRIFYSINDSKTPTINSIFAILLNILLNILFSRIYGLKGLAMGTSLSIAICTVTLSGLLYFKEIIHLDVKKLIFVLVKIIFSTVIMGIFCKFIYNNFLPSTSSKISLLLSLFGGSILYFTLIYILNIEIFKSRVNSAFIYFFKK